MHGAIDAKVANLSLVKNLQMYAVSGPTSGPDVPIFNWNYIHPNDYMDHLGHPNEFNFAPEIHDWIL